MSLHNNLLDCNLPLKTLLSTLVSGVFVLFLVTQSQANRDTPFSWSANTDVPPVDGFKLYYKIGDPGQTLSEYNGSDAENGNPSPVVISGSDKTTYTLLNLLESKKYSFVLTSFRGVAESAPTSPIILDATTTNSAPTSLDSIISVNGNTSFTGQLNASDPEGDSLTFTVVNFGSMGNVEILNQNTGSYTYTPNSGAIGSDSFTFRVNDGMLDSNVAVVSVSITAVNRAPSAGNGLFSTNENTDYNGQLSATDPDGDSLTYSIVSNGSRGNVILSDNSNGSFIYTPNTGVTGSDSFTFRVNDGMVNSNIGTVIVTITNVNSGPTASNGSILTNEDTPYNGQLIASDPDGDVLTYSIVNNGTKGHAVLSNAESGVFTYTPNANENGYDSFTFRVSDGTLQSTIATISILVVHINDPPTVNNAVISIDQNTLYNGVVSGKDQEGDTLTFSIVSNGKKGNVVIDNQDSGTFTYTPFPNEFGSDSFRFIANDGLANSAEGLVIIYIKDAAIIEKVFGDAVGSDFPGTLSDTYTNLNSNVYAASEIMYTWSWSTAAPYKVANTLILKADLSSIPSYAEIIDATLHLYQSESYGDLQYYNSVHKIIGKSPKVKEVTGFDVFNGEPWSSVPANTTENDVPLGLSDIATEEDAIMLDELSGYKIWSITNMVKDWYKKPMTNSGLLVCGVPAQSNTGRAFATSENQNTSIRPKLVVRYRLHPAPKIISVKEVK